MIVDWKRVPLLSIAQSDEETFIAVGTRGMVLVSHDAGRVWRQAPSPTDVTLTSVAVNAKGTVFAVGHEETVLRSDDKGASWQLITTAPAGATFLRIRFFGETNGFVTGSSGTLLRTVDKGDTWARSTLAAEDDGFDPQLLDVAELQSGELIIAAEAGHIFRSVDQGISWSPVTTPYNGTFFGAKAISGQTLVVYGMLGHAFLSSDAGDSWQRIDTGANQSFFDAIVTGDVVYLAGADGMLASAPRTRLGRFSLTAVASRPAISGLLPAGDGLLGASDQGLVSIPVARRPKQGESHEQQQ